MMSPKPPLTWISGNPKLHFYEGILLLSISSFETYPDVMKCAPSFSILQYKVASNSYHITKNLMLLFMLKNIIIGGLRLRPTTTYSAAVDFDIPYLNRNVHATCKIMHENTDVSTCFRS